jgi:hypothetical protein
MESTFKVFILDNNNGMCQLKITEHQFDTNGSAKSFVRDADKYGLGGIDLVILEVHNSN